MIPCPVKADKSNFNAISAPDSIPNVGNKPPPTKSFNLVNAVTIPSTNLITPFKPSESIKLAYNAPIELESLLVTISNVSPCRLTASIMAPVERVAFCCNSITLS